MGYAIIQLAKEVIGRSIMQMTEVQPEAKTDAPQNIYHKVTIEEAQARLPELLEAVKRGEAVFILIDENFSFQLGFVATKLIDYIVSRPRRKPGLAKGQIWMSEDFDEPLEDFEEYM
jgi:antitoxin (DNA-binding transcriptional repressor) of toxin-antitoxin stability system